MAGIPTTDETDWQAVGKRIRDARERRGLKQTELAEAIDVRAHTMWRYEAGRLSFKAETLTRIAVALGVSERWLMTGREAESVELDEELGPPGMESYFQNMEAEGTPVPLAMKRELRDRAQSEGPRP